MFKKNKTKEQDEVTYWQSYSDMMAAMLLVFILIISFTISDAKRVFEEKQEEVNQKQEELKKQQETMKQQQDKIDKLVGVRGELIESLKVTFEGTDLKVDVDPQTGAIMFDSSVLFDYNEYALKKTGQDFLTKFLPRYFSAILDKDYIEYVSEIIIEGHTDTNGTYFSNLELSQKRALSVAKFCLSDNSVLGKERVNALRSMVTANGKSYSNPIYNKDGTVNMDQSRRVEFKFRLKDEEMIGDMKDILEN